MNSTQAFLGYQFTDVALFINPETHLAQLREIINPLRVALFDAYGLATICSLDSEEYFQEHLVKRQLSLDDKARIINQYMASFIPGSSRMIVLLRNPRESTGLQIETDIAQKNKVPIDLFIKEGLDHEAMRKKAENRILEYNSVSQLYSLVTERRIPWL